MNEIFFHYLMILHILTDLQHYQNQIQTGNAHFNHVFQTDLIFITKVSIVIHERADIR